MSSDNPNRVRAKSLILLLPGIHLRRLSKLLGLQPSTTRYHVHRLERDGEILCSKDGEFLRSYPVSVRDERERRTWALLQKKNARKILKTLVNSGAYKGLTNEDLSRMTGLSESTISVHVGTLRELDLLRKVPAKEGGWVLEVNPDEKRRLSAALSEIERNTLSVATDSYVALWNI